MKRFLTMIGLGLLIMFYQNCGGGFRPAQFEDDQLFNNVPEDLGNTDGAVNEPVIAEKAQEVLTANCAGCHAPGLSIVGVPEGLSDLTVMLNSGNIIGEYPDRSIMIQSVEGKRTLMPPTGALSAEDIATLRQWVESVPRPVVIPVSFTVDIKPILEANCVSCHSLANAQGNVMLNTHANVALNVVPGDAANSPISLLIQGMGGNGGNQRMPPPPNALLNQTQINLINNWINEGAVDN